MHPLDTRDRTEFMKQAASVGDCTITDNGIIPLKERLADTMDRVVCPLRKFRGQRKQPA